MKKEILEVLNHYSSFQPNLASEEAREQIASSIVSALEDSYITHPKIKTTANGYKVGDWVVLTSERPFTWNYKGKMDHLLSKTIKIDGIKPTLLGGKRVKRVIFAGVDDWWVSPKDIARYATEEEILAVGG